ncbi:MAG: glycerophosphodiester phosphodiesterase, partial [Deltaproteobacteria bacterium]|nr:glycerophosphodiester phosphodiesterase [Deltaproteobacteria bacterium]
PRVWAHRGASAHAPENTMLAFDKAREAGADGIELDVRLDADGTVIVFHDRSLQRLTGQPGLIDQTSATARAELRVSGEPVPLLADVLHTYDFEVNVEIKSDQPGRAAALVEATARVIKASGRIDTVLVSSFDPLALVQLHRHLPGVALGYIFGKDQSLPLRRGWAGIAVGASLVHPQHTLCTKKTVAAWQRAGTPINVWTVDDRAELLRLAELGVDGVFSNDPAHAIAVLSEP